jgi:DNA-binding phage protein
MPPESIPSALPDQAEVWKDVAGVVGYQVSNLGRVRSRRLPDVWLIIKGSADCRGYMRVCIPYPDKPRTVKVHRLVLMAFVGPSPASTETCHEDGNPANNRLTNLRWGTRKDNARDRRRHGHDLLGESHPDAKLTTEQVKFIRRLSLFPKSRLQIARQLGVSKSAVDRIQDGKTWQSVADDGNRLLFSPWRLREVMRTRGMTGPALRKSAGLAAGMVSRFLSRQREPSWRTVCRMAVALCVDFAALCDEV